MNKKILIGSIIAVVLLTLMSFSNVVGYNTIKTSQEELIGNEYSFDECKEYLFQTIVDISENPEIKDIIKSNYKPQITILPFRRSNVDLKVEHLELLYEMGLKIMDRLGEDRVEELMENIEIPEFADELDSIVMGNDELRERIYTLNEMNSVEVSILDWENTPVLCLILYLLILPIFLVLFSPFYFLLHILWKIKGDDWLMHSIMPWIYIGIPVMITIIITFPLFLLLVIFRCDIPQFYLPP